MSEEERNTLRQQVDKALHNIKRFVDQDGGDLDVVDITDEYVVKIELKGACTNCSMNNMTFKAGVEEAILKALPQIKAVEAHNFQLSNS